MTIKFDREATLEVFRRAVLDALDDTTKALFSEKDGWQDQDLPKLFVAIDKHVEALALRYDINLEEYDALNDFNYVGSRHHY